MNPSSNTDNESSENSPEAGERKPDLDSHGFARRIAKAEPGDEADVEEVVEAASAEIEATNETMVDNAADGDQVSAPVAQEVQESVSDKNIKVFRSRLVGIRQNVDALHEKLNQLDKTKR